MPVIIFEHFVINIFISNEPNLDKVRKLTYSNGCALMKDVLHSVLPLESA